MALQLKRPLIWFDQESTGVNTTVDRICEIAFIKQMPDGTLDKRQMIIDPGISIPKQASDIHGITDEVIAKLKADGKAPLFSKVAPNIFKFIQGCDVAGYGIINFDIPMLSEEFARCGIQWPEPDMKALDNMNIFKKKEERTLKAALKFYCGKELKDAHEALADIEASMEVIDGQLDKYSDLKELSFDELCAYSKMDDRLDLNGFFVKNEDGKVVFNVGKHKNSPVAEVFKTDHSYYNWIMKSDMSADTKRHAQSMYERINPPKKQ